MSPVDAGRVLIPAEDLALTCEFCAAEGAVETARFGRACAGCLGDIVDTDSDVAAYEVEELKGLLVLRNELKQQRWVLADPNAKRSNAE